MPTVSKPTAVDHFAYCYRSLMPFEGQWSDDELDTGGETWKGVSRNNFPNLPMWKIIDGYKKKPGFPHNLNESRELELAVQSFYRENFWNNIQLNKIPSQAVCFEIFELAVNSGTSQGIKCLQEALNFLNLNGKLYPDLLPDGDIGEKTLGAVLTLIRRGDEAFLVKAINGEQYSLYKAITKRKPDQEIFSRSWVRRT